MDRDGLADFLKRRRDVLQPDDVGLHAGTRRRARGLRREEVAALAHMSTDFYARLEQQRGSRPSEQMTAAQIVSDLGVTPSQNPLAEALVGVQTRHTGLQRSIIYRWFTDPNQRRIHPEADHPLRRSDEFAALWERDEVASRAGALKRFVHRSSARSRSMGAA
jgi:transcriptional regulator with XRE-family HTH domain